MNPLQLFLPCAAGVEEWLAAEVSRLTGLACERLRGGVRLRADWRAMMVLNLHSRLAQRVLIELSCTPYRGEDDLYAAARALPWEDWFTPRQSFKVEITAQHSPLKSLNFALLRVKDAVADRFRERTGVRPDVATRSPEVRLFAHLTHELLTLYIDSSGEPLFKRGWREDKGEAPLKETLAAAMLAASGWDAKTPLYDPCCGSGTILIEAAQIACGIAPGLQRRFAFERLLPFVATDWKALREAAQAQRHPGSAPIFGSDVAFRMVDFARRNAERAGVAHAIELHGGDALQRTPPCAAPGVMLLNPPYGERIEAAGLARPGRRPAGREVAQSEGQDDFFLQLARHWKAHYNGWTAWLLTPDLKLPGRLRMKESRRVPMWNGPIECRMFRFEISPPPRRDAPVAAAP